MSAELLREAAALMRERAEGATPGPWRFWNDGHVGAPDTRVGGIVKPTPMSLHEQHVPDAAHIASWHPTVALAVADWLDEYARLWDASEATTADIEHAPIGRHALAVARAYLGEAPP